MITRNPPTFNCQHGEKECYGNMIELCAINHYPNIQWDYILCQESSVDFSDEGVTKCAEEAGMDASVILKCANGKEGPLLHLEAADKTPEHNGVPWVIVDGKVKTDQDDLIDMICDAYKGEKPKPCNQSLEELVKHSSKDIDGINSPKNIDSIPLPKDIISSPTKVAIAVYYEVLCSTCVFFIIDELNKFRQKTDLMEIVTIDMVAFGNGKVITRDPPTFWCQHGEKECYGNMVELCAVEHFVDSYWEFIMCQELAGTFGDEQVQSCAEKTGLDASVLLDCAKGTEGPLLHLAAADRTPPEHTYVPWVTVNGVLKNGKTLIQMVCEAYEGEKPESCKTVV